MRGTPHCGHPRRASAVANSLVRPNQPHAEQAQPAPQLSKPAPQSSRLTMHQQRPRPPRHKGLRSGTHTTEKQSCTTATCAKFSERRQSRILCKGIYNIAGSNSFEWSRSIGRGVSPTATDTAGNTATSTGTVIIEASSGSADKATSTVPYFRLPRSCLSAQPPKSR
jgi:hypothetical protein